MYESVDELNALLDVEAESISLEFKDGAKLDTFDDRAKQDLITDVTAFANAGGGTVIYGIREERRDGRSVAAALAPVTNQAVTQDRLREVIFSNTDPALRGFDIRTIAVPGGTAFVIAVEEGDTAYQNRMDRRYFGRVDASSVPMYGFAIRDVMNRRTTPKVLGKLSVVHDDMRQNAHRYTVVPNLANEGMLTANHWNLIVALPAALAAVSNDPHGTIVGLGEETIGGNSVQLFRLSSERLPPATAGRLLPGESRDLDMGSGWGMLRLSIAAGNQQQMRQLSVQPSLRLSLFVDNSPRSDAEVPFREWCRW